MRKSSICGGDKLVSKQLRCTVQSDTRKSVPNTENWEICLAAIAATRTTCFFIYLQENHDCTIFGRLLIVSIKKSSVRNLNIPFVPSTTPGGVIFFWASKIKLRGLLLKRPIKRQKLILKFSIQILFQSLKIVNSVSR